MDDRFYTPRASVSRRYLLVVILAVQLVKCCFVFLLCRSVTVVYLEAVSTRSNGSFATPRASLHSHRSVSSSDSLEYRTPRSTQKSPAELMGVHGHHHGHHRGGSPHDRSSDFRRFSDNVSFSRRPASASVPPSSYRGERNALSGPSLSANAHGILAKKNERNLNIFSLARHGREGEVEELLLRGNMQKNG